MKIQIFAFASCLVTLISTYEFSSSQLLAKPSCYSNVTQQSPIDISSSKYYLERDFRIINSHYDVPANVNWTTFSEERAIGFQGDFGNVTLVKNWAMYNFNLKKILFRIGSSHSIMSQGYDAEIEFVHQLNEEYRTPGRNIKATSNYLVVSVFLKVVDPIKNQTFSDIFKYVNLTTSTSNGAALNKSIKFGRLVQHSKQFFYEGRLPYDKCQKSWYIIDPTYQAILQSELDSLKAQIKTAGFIDDKNPQNTRIRQNIDTATVVYRNEENLMNYLIEPSLLQFVSTGFLKLDLLIVLISIIGLLYN